MGMYTGLRGKIELEPFMIHAFNMGGTYGCLWRRAVELAPNKEVSLILSEWRKLPRADSIPFGYLAYMPDEWEESWKEPEVKDGFLHFSCSLKNYNNEIETFIDYVLPLIGKSWSLESLYEEDENSTWHIGPLDETLRLEGEEK